MELFPGYCIDTSALVDLWRRKYSPDVFPALWKEIEELISKGDIIAPREVFKELEKADDELFKWLKKRRRMFQDLDASQLSQVPKILSQFRNLVDENKTRPEADPFVIALAMSKGWTVITSEQPANLNANPTAKPKIPDVCAHYSIKCIYHLLEFFREKGWRF